MTLLYTSPRFLDHQTKPHPESPHRLSAILRRLRSAGWLEKCAQPQWPRATVDELTAVHGRDYLSEIETLCRRGGGFADADTPVCDASFDAALLAAGAACDAVRRVTAGEDRTALCLVRPPGHHAMPDHAMGFCLLGNAAIAARLAVDHLGLDRVLVVDWDVHHGNGTQAMCYDDPRIGFFSAHRWPFYPGTGAADETGAGDGLGATRNLPIAMGTSRRDYLQRLKTELESFAAHIRPQLVIMSAGFDAHREDPIGSLGLETEDYGPMTKAVCDVAAVHAEGRIVSALEGGYNIRVLGDCAELHLRELFTEPHGA